MTRPRALDLFCCAGGVSTGLQRAGFDVTGVDINPQPHYRGGTFIQADALTFPLEGFDFIHASPPCQSFSSLRHLNPGKIYPDLIEAVRDRLVASGKPYSIENVPGAPLGNPNSFLILLCGTMFGLTTPDGRAELRRHRLFETSFYIFPHPECRHGGRESLSVSGSGLSSNPASHARRVISVHGSHGLPGESIRRREARGRLVLSIAGDHPDAKTGGRSRTGLSSDRERFSVADARHAMGIDWPMPMKYLSQAIPPPYAEFIGRHALPYL